MGDDDGQNGDADDLLTVPFRPHWQPGDLVSEEPYWEPPTVGDQPLLGLKGRPQDLRGSLHPLLAALTHESITAEGRRRKLEALPDFLPDLPVHQERLSELKDRGVTAEDFSEAAVATMAAASWRDEVLEEGPAPEGHPVHPEEGVWLRLDRLRAHLGREVTERVLGVGGRRQEAGLEKLAAPLDLDRKEDPEDLERQVAARLELQRHRRRVERRAERLTEAQREVYLRVERDGFTPSEAAAELDISPAAARNRLKRARSAVGSTEY